MSTLWTLVPSAVRIDHIGSTAVSGLAAKDCLDAMISVPDVAAADLSALAKAGYRERPEPWNRVEMLDGVEHPKLVFAPPVGGRRVNIHVRNHGSPTQRFALLFRDYLRADATRRHAWGDFKMQLSATDADIYAYGQLKATMQPLLMTLAEQWALETDWRLA